jgi:deoxyribonuclease IV
MRPPKKARPRTARQRPAAPAAPEQPPPGDELGAHVSTAGGVDSAPGRAALIESVVLQLFTKQPSRWAEPTLAADTVARYAAETARCGIRFAASHDSYLINLASPDPVLHARSLDSFRAELRRAAQLGVPCVVTHPGNATDGDVASGIARNADALARALHEIDSATILLETTAGSGKVLGRSFDELAQMLDRIPAPLQHRLGVCVDTCHVWAAGYDLVADYDGVFARFDDVLGIDRIRLFHLNDSVGSLGSRRDRHAGIGEGALGETPFQRLMNDDRFANVPKVLETPKGHDHTASDLRNLNRLRGYR